MNAMPLRRIAALTAVAFALAGCSAIGGGGATGTTTGIRAQVTPIYQELARCFRQNGYPDFPDPVVKDDGTVDLPEDVDRRIQQLESRLRPACEHIVNRLPESVRKGRPDEAEQVATPEQIDQLRRFARCARQNGYPDWPDPKADGTFPVTDQWVRENGLETKTPRFLNAMRHCRQLTDGNDWRIRFSKA